MEYNYGMISKKVCHCFGAGDFFGLCSEINGGDIVIAADGGLNAAEKCGIKPDFVIGDFDSLGKIPVSGNVTVLPAEKDTTDMFEAVKKGADEGCTRFNLYGGTGGRLDHTIANLQLLKYFSEKALSLFLYGDGFALTAVTDGKISLKGKSGGYVSVFSLSDTSEGVTLKGLKYGLSDYTLKSSFPLGVSNEFTDNTAEISVKSGTLAVYYTL